MSGHILSWGFLSCRRVGPSPDRIEIRPHVGAFVESVGEIITVVEFSNGALASRTGSGADGAKLLAVTMGVPTGLRGAAPQVDLILRAVMTVWMRVELPTSLAKRIRPPLPHPRQRRDSDQQP